MARSKLEAHLKALRLPTFLREYDKLARQCAAEMDSRSFLQQLCELELLDREQRATERRIKAAKFPVTKSLDTFDFPSLPALNKKLVLELARCEFIDRRENVLALGNSGTGKTHIGLALGLAACQRGYHNSGGLVNELPKPEMNGAMSKAVGQAGSADRRCYVFEDRSGVIVRSVFPALRTGLDAGHLESAV